MTFDERYEQLAQEGRIYGEIEKEKIRLLDVPQIRDEIIATLKGIPDLTCVTLWTHSVIAAAKVPFPHTRSRRLRPLRWRSVLP